MEGATSHIIPKALYGSTLNDPSGVGKLVSNSAHSKSKRSPQGEYDQELLCPTCEASLSTYDAYAAKIFMQTNAKNDTFKEGKLLVSRINRVDVDRLKIFFATLLWRMHASTREAFQNVNLGPYASRFKHASHNKSSALLSELDVVIQKFDIRNTPILFPTFLRIDSVNGFRIVFNGYSCWVKVDARPIPTYLSEISLSHSSDVLYFLHSEFAESPEFRALRRIIKPAKDG